MTTFRRRVYEALGLVPSGFVTTYGDLAGYIGCGSARAVGQALRANPFAPRVPCHRVIAGDLSPGGFQGERGGAALQRKLDLLGSEGVGFDAGRLRDRQRVFSWPAPGNARRATTGAEDAQP
jgi:methylated-DNA-[protein]-cysteine S-methyltransferase